MYYVIKMITLSPRETMVLVGLGFAFSLWFAPETELAPCDDSLFDFAFFGLI
jgi:hypothetical protein